MASVSKVLLQPEERANFFALLSTSRQVYREALPRFWSQDGLQISAEGVDKAPTLSQIFEPTFPVHHFQMIRSLTVCFKIQRIGNHGVFDIMSYLRDHGCYDNLFLLFEIGRPDRDWHPFDAFDVDAFNGISREWSCELFTDTALENELVRATCAIKVRKLLSIKYGTSNSEKSKHDEYNMKSFIETVAAEKGWEHEQISESQWYPYPRTENSSRQVSWDIKP